MQKANWKSNAKSDSSWLLDRVASFRWIMKQQGPGNDTSEPAKSVLFEKSAKPKQKIHPKLRKLSEFLVCSIFSKKQWARWKTNVFDAGLKIHAGADENLIINFRRPYRRVCKFWIRLFASWFRTSVQPNQCFLNIPTSLFLGPWLYFLEMFYSSLRYTLFCIRTIL